MPAVIPVRIPEAEPIVALAVLLLLQVPPASVLLSVAVAPAHMVLLPLIAAAAGLTVMSVVVMQPEASV